jgi:hypothetical protein
MKLSDLTPNAKNPRTITDAKLAQLKKALEKFGDLGGVVYNRRTKRLVTGHQRLKSVPLDTAIILEKKYSSPTKTGTIAEGYFKVGNERFQYRGVDWDEATEKAACIAANKNAGSWDNEILSEWLKELNAFDLDFDLDLTMFDADEIESVKSITISEHQRAALEDKEKKKAASTYILEVELSNQKEMVKVYKDLIAQGLIVRCRPNE